MNMSETMMQLKEGAISKMAKDALEKEGLTVESVHELKMVRPNRYLVSAATRTHTYTRTIEIYFNGVEVLGAVYKRVKAA